MRLCTFVLAFLFVHDLAGAVPRSTKKCPPQCDVGSCPSPSCPSGYVPDRCNCCLVCSRAEGDPCGRKNDLPCGEGLECKSMLPGTAGKRRGAKRLCQCKTGQKVCGMAQTRRVTPSLNGSVLLFLIWTRASLCLASTVTSPTLRELGSERVVVGEVYSDTLSKAKNAKRTADNSMSLSQGFSDKTMCLQMTCSNSHVMGALIGRVNLLP